MSKPPDQSRAWDAYGHALAAAACLDLIFKVSNFHDRAIALRDSSDIRNVESKSQKIIDQPQSALFSTSANEFYASHQELQSDEFRTELDNAIGFRNYLAHKFILVAHRFLGSEEGLDIIATECAHYRDHFVGIEEYIWANGNCDFARFFDERPDTEAMIRNHPIHRFNIGEFDSLEQALSAVGWPPKLD